MVAQGGTVSTMALDFGVSLVCCPAADRVVRLTSSAFEGTVEFSLDSIPPRSTNAAEEEGSWGNFPRGAAFALQKRGHRSISQPLCSDVPSDSPEVKPA